MGIRGSLDARPRLNEVTACEPVRYDYEVTFLSQACIARNWPRYFELQDIVRGAIRHFQDIVGLRRRDDSVAPEPER